MPARIVDNLLIWSADTFYIQALAAIILGQMRPLLIIIFIGVSLTRVFAQTEILGNGDGHVTDTLDDNSLSFVKNDTLTRFLIGKAQSTDHCSSFSIIRKQYKKEQVGFRQLETRTIVINTKCSNLWNEDNVYCLRLVEFKLRKGTVNIAIVDSDDKKMKTRIKGDNDFEFQLKDKVDKFISKVECNGVRIE
jgi:hypothetical protein